MFTKLFSKKPKEQKPESNTQTQNSKENSPGLTAMLNYIKTQSQTDPLIGAKIGAQEVYHKLTEAMKGADKKGVHAESLLCILGSLAGYSCLASVIEQSVEKGPEAPSELLMVSRGGKTYFFGDPITNAMSNNVYSVWDLAARAASGVGCKELIDIHEIYDHTAKSIGTPEFGIVRFPEGHNATDIPVNYVKDLWPVTFPTVKTFCPKPSDWPILLSIAANIAIVQGKDIVPPCLALKIVMESAVSMSKILITEY